MTPTCAGIAFASGQIAANCSPMRRLWSITLHTRIVGRKMARTAMATFTAFGLAAPYDQR